MTVTIPWQGAFNGLAFGPGTDVQLSDYGMLRALPAIRSGDVSKPRQDGSFGGLNYLDERIFTTDLLVFAPVAAFETVVGNVATAFQNIQDPSNLLPFEVLLPGWPNSRFINCRPTKGGLPVDVNFQFNQASIAIELTAPDPLIYSTVLKTSSAGLPSPIAGRTFPITFPTTFGASTGGSMSVTNAGNYTTAPVITITGPVTNPIVTFTSTGAFMALTITLANTDVLVIDMGARTVTLNGTAYRFNTVVTGSSWWGIPPGTWSIGVASSDSAPVTALFSTAYRDAWGWM